MNVKLLSFSINIEKSFITFAMGLRRRGLDLTLRTARICLFNNLRRKSKIRGVETQRIKKCTRVHIYIYK